MKHILVFSTVLISVCSSLLLDYTASRITKTNVIALMLVGTVYCINLFKFIVWGWIHKRFDVNKSYPLISIFFPIIFVISYFKGETELSFCKIFGVTLIIIGLLIFEKKKQKEIVS